MGDDLPHQSWIAPWSKLAQDNDRRARHQPPDHKHSRRLCETMGDDLPHQSWIAPWVESAQDNDRRAPTSASGSQAFAKVVQTMGDDLPHQSMDRTLGRELAQDNDRRAPTSASDHKHSRRLCETMGDDLPHQSGSHLGQKLAQVMTGEPRHQPPDHKHFAKVVRNNGRHPPTLPLDAPWVRSCAK
ncbi:hypothetical protein Hypma_004929 [Hypsizygus marmoreus]|uniref:Uncharacterized protein n=1 Tax=Hypsizygus marmoreus TaxID=39966 RepID=A0A369K8L4_HYPMA|nr:hypothetical protein Hypma_004929 [Hypsizygus marmoreus]